MRWRMSNIRFGLVLGGLTERASNADWRGKQTQKIGEMLWKPKESIRHGARVLVLVATHCYFKGRLLLQSLWPLFFIMLLSNIRKYDYTLWMGRHSHCLKTYISSFQTHQGLYIKFCVIGL